MCPKSDIEDMAISLTDEVSSPVFTVLMFSVGLKEKSGGKTPLFALFTRTVTFGEN